MIPGNISRGVKKGGGKGKKSLNGVKEAHADPLLEIV